MCSVIIGRLAIDEPWSNAVAGIPVAQDRNSSTGNKDEQWTNTQCFMMLEMYFYVNDWSNFLIYQIKKIFYFYFWDEMSDCFSIPK